jgi:hypothetical protein
MIAALSICRRGPAFGSTLVRMIGSTRSQEANVSSTANSQDGAGTIVHRLVVLPAANHPTSVSPNHLVFKYRLKDEPAVGRQRRVRGGKTR